MTRDEYNAKVQEMQRFCIAAGMQHRVRTSRDDAIEQPWYRREPSHIEAPIGSARFEVLYGHWRMLGYQRDPFQPNSTYEWFEPEAIKLQGEVARDIGT